MEVDLVAVIVQAGALGLAVLLLFLMWKTGMPLLNRLMDHLDEERQNYITSVKIQADVAATLQNLCQQVSEVDRESRDRDQRQDALLADIANRLEELGATQRGLQNQMQAHEGRAQKRADQSLAQGQEIVTALRELGQHLKSLNGKT